MRRALSEFIISGVETTIPLLKLIFEDRDFVEGKIHTKFLEERMDMYISKLKRDLTLKIAIAISTIDGYGLRGNSNTNITPTNGVSPKNTYYTWKFSQLFYTS